MKHFGDRKTIRRKSLRRRGTTAVEFALVFPVALLFFVSLITLVQGFIIRNAAENAAYFGARRGIIPGATDQSIRNVISEEVRLGLTSNFTANINRLGDFVTVTVTVPMQGNAWATGGFAPEILTITQTCTLRKQEE
ncbi:MAG TPA: hypothetical protein DDZ51_06410 [Planctomycetaceae bacterium]|nr:hypothetical protein [Planctomycetaceae bacterium]